jgi:uncharacterized protein YbjT (DUF2867 family)
MPQSVLLAGATGLVGGECLRLLLADPEFDPVHVVVRRPLPTAIGSGKLRQHVTEFDRIAAALPDLRLDAVFCALGTTIRKAGSQEAFRKVDFEYPLALARVALERGARHYLLVSSLGADSGSRVFYSRTKGELEEALSALPFRSLTIARPSLLLGERSEFRLGERVFAHLGFLVPRMYKPVPATAVVATLVAAAREDRPGRRIIESAEMLGMS